MQEWNARRPRPVCSPVEQEGVPWPRLLRDPVLAVGEGALGFWNALSDVFPDTRHQRCWVRKTITDDEAELLAFFDFPAEHWIHLRSTNPIESTFATVRLRTKVTKGAGSRAAGLGMVFELGRGVL